MRPIYDIDLRKGLLELERRREELIARFPEEWYRAVQQDAINDSLDNDYRRDGQRPYKEPSRG